MSAYQRFIFKKYEFDVANKSLELYYNYDGILDFTESFHFDFDLYDYDPLVLDRACQLLFFMAGVSYYKAYLAPEIVVECGEINQRLADFLSKTYQKGLGEFFYVNKLDPRTEIKFPVNAKVLSTPQHNSSDELLIGIGGGKDSLVTTEALRDIPKVSTWSLGHRPQLTDLVERTGLPHLWVERQWDRSLLEHNSDKAYNGHIPISAIFACVGLVTAVLSGKSDVVVSNENSANEPTLNYQGVDINHQYSKSLEFEKDFQKVLRHVFNDSYRYYSFLRPLSEVRIAEIFANSYFDKYKDVFSSCNRAFTHNNDKMFWCGECSKCAFSFMALSPFVPRDKLEKLFNGKNLFNDPKLETIYDTLLGIAGPKPLDCVGDIKESREAMQLSQKIYTELSKYKFDIPESYHYRALSAHSMPDNLYQILLKLVDEQPE